MSTENKKDDNKKLYPEFYLQREPWKVWMTPSPKHACATLESLYDLMFYEDENGKPILRSDAVDEENFIGKPLGHDIIIYREDLYNNEGKIDITQDIKLWSIYGIDLAMPVYDIRSKPFDVTIAPDPEDSPEVKEAISQFSSTYGHNFFVRDTDAAIPFDDAISLYKGYAYNRRSWRSEVSQVTSPSNFNMGSLKIGDFGLEIGTQERKASHKHADIILCGIDKVFRTSMVFEKSKSPWTQMILNPHGTHGDNILRQAFIETAQKSVEGELKDLPVPDIRLLIQNEQFKEFFKSIKVWVKAAFAADYVKPKDFNQNLNQDSDVIHANVYASRTGDFNRYDRLVGMDAQTDVGEGKDFGLSSNSLPYVPKSSPLKDFVSEKFYTDKGTISETVEKLIENSNVPGSNIGSVLSEPGFVKFFNDKHVDGSIPDEEDMVTPLNFFDPESRRSVESYNRVPTIIPKKGNIFSDERIISPTIDELWYIIKKMISGRQSDTVVDTYDTDFTRARGRDGALNRASTTLTEIRKAEYKWDQDDAQHLGDPIDFEYEFDDDNKLGRVKSIKVKEWLTQPTEVNYKIYKDNYDDVARISHWTSEGYTPIEEVAINGIEIFKPEHGEVTHTAEAGARWGTRLDPLTLRELEARTLGNKFEIVKNFRYITTNFATVGGLGYTDETGVGGSLYQLHKDFNYKHDTPNTYWKFNGDGETGTDVVYGDYEQLTEEERQLEDSYVGVNGDEATSNLVRYAAHYGRSEMLKDNQDEITAAQVYLSAEGKWRYSHEHVRIPVLRSRY